MDDDAFPSSVELTAASALLLLAESPRIVVSSPRTTASSPSMSDPVKELLADVETKSKKLQVQSKEQKTAPSDSISCRSSITTSEGTSDAVYPHRLQVVATATARCHVMKLKVVRRARSRVHYVSKFSSSKTWKTASPPSTSPPETISSCLSTDGSGGSSEISSGRSRRGRKRTVAGEVGTRSTHIRRRAEAIMRLLAAGGGSSEVRIRMLLGDSPDTSKALRMLVKMEKVRRTGTGGRYHPYIYMIAADSTSFASSKPVCCVI